jgi:hypothetical protein
VIATENITEVSQSKEGGKWKEHPRCSLRIPQNFRGEFEGIWPEPEKPSDYCTTKTDVLPCIHYD